MLTSNHTSQNATSPEICFGQTMKVCLLQHSTAFWHPFKTFRLSSSWRPASQGLAMLLESRRSPSCYRVAPAKMHAPQDDAMGERETSKKNQARSWSNWWFHCTHLETTLVQRQLSRSDRRDRGMFDRRLQMRKGGSVLEDLILEWWSTGICFRCLEKAKHILPNRGLMVLHHGIN